MRFDIITIFPDIFDSYFNTSIVKRAKDKKKVKIQIHDLRKFADKNDPRKSVDDTPYGGGAGMLLKPEPLYRALKKISRRKKSRVILFSAKGKVLSQKDLKRWEKNYDQLIMVCGRYEGIDERITEHMVDEEVSIGEYVLTGGELPAMIVVDGVTRLIPGVLGAAESLEGESHEVEGLGAFPQYTKPEVFKGWKVPDVLLSGHHAKIKEWRESQRKKIKK